jgi:predicted branched-subunit amino acid permease
MASFGNASGPVPPFAVGTLGAKGSLYITRQTLFTHIATRETTQQMADELFAVVVSRRVHRTPRPLVWSLGLIGTLFALATALGGLVGSLLQLAGALCIITSLIFLVRQQRLARASAVMVSVLQ